MRVNSLSRVKINVIIDITAIN